MSAAPLSLAAAALALVLAGCETGESGAAGPPPDRTASVVPSTEEPSPETPSTAPAPALRPGGPGVWPPAADSIAGTPWTHADWRRFQEVVRRSDAAGVGSLPLGEALVAVGRSLVGTPYVARTLEVPGPERLVVNLRALDCVTFVENVLALTRFVRVHGVHLLDDPAAARAAFESDLRDLRYRDGRIEGYASRLHYFSDWLAEHQSAGRIRLVTGDLGGVPDPEPVDFMSRHPQGYPQLSDERALAQVVQVEARLGGAGPRIYLPEAALETASQGIRDGDIIAATSTVEGLDVAHTGLAVRVDGVVHLMHAPLVGSEVVISPRPLARRIVEIGSQDGVMVARPLPEWFERGA